MAVSGVNMISVKNQNRSTIINHIYKNGPVSRKDIADATGLTPAAVTQLCQGLIQEEILTETGEREGTGAGRKKVLMDLDYNSRFVFSVNIEQTKTVIALCNLKGEAYEKMVINSADLDEIAKCCIAMRERVNAKTAKKIGGISVAVPGVVDQENGVAVHAYGIWEKEVHVCDILSEKLGLPCMLSNNVNAFAQASMIFGIGRTYDNIMVIKWGPGVGGTIVIDNKVYEGRHGRAAELGHFIVKKDGRKCNCGRQGCLETLVSYSALKTIVPFAEDDFAKAYFGAEPEAKRQIDDAIDLFARSIVNTITVLAPNRVVLCGFLFKDEAVRNKLIDCVSAYDAGINEHRIVYTDLAESEDFIGPVATYIYEQLMNG